MELQIVPFVFTALAVQLAFYYEWVTLERIAAGLVCLFTERPFRRRVLGLTLAILFWWEGYYLILLLAGA